MFRRIIAHLAAGKLRRERSVAFQAHRQAVLRGDTRRQHETRQALTKATTALLRAEVAR